MEARVGSRCVALTALGLACVSCGEGEGPVSTFPILAVGVVAGTVVHEDLTPARAQVRIQARAGLDCAPGGDQFATDEMPRALPGGGYEFGGVVTDSLGRYLHQLWATEPLEACFAVVVTREPAGRDTVALSHRMLLRADPDTLTVDVTLP